MSRFRQNLPFQTVATLELKDCVGNGEVGGDNAGPMVEIFQEDSGIREGKDPWCAAAVFWAARAASAKKNQPNPLRNVPLKGLVQSYVDYFREQDRVFKDPSKATVGDLFCLWYPWLNEGDGRYGHMGFVDVREVPDGRFATVEGNTTADHPEAEESDREGELLTAKHRSATANDPIFIRWAR